MGDGTTVGLEDDFLARLQSLSDGGAAISIPQLDHIMPQFPEHLTVSQLNEMVRIASDQCGIWVAEYMFSPVNAPNTEAEAEADSWRNISKKWQNMLIEHAPNAREDIIRRHDLMMAKHTVDRSLDYNKHRPVQRLLATGLSLIAIGLGRLGFQSIGDHLYKIALYPRSTIGRSPHSTMKQLSLMKESADREIERIRTKTLEGLNQCAKEGAVITTDKVLERLDELKSSYQGPNREQFFSEIDKMKQAFRDKYGATIPVDEAYKIVTEYEQKRGL